MDQKETQLESALIEIAKNARPSWAVQGEVELYSRTSGIWVCHSGKCRAHGQTPMEAVTNLKQKIKEAQS